MKKFIIALAATAALLFGSLLVPNTAAARPWAFRGGPYYGGFYRPYYRPYYYNYSYGYSPYYYNYSYRYPYYNYGYRYTAPYYYGYPGYRTGARIVAPGVGVYVR